MNLKITSYCKILDESCLVNNKNFPFKKNVDETLTKSLYKALGIKYPKFYKMDVLAKYGFLATEILLSENTKFKTYAEDEVALLFSNSNSCLQTDLKYQETIKRDKPSPSPALFVYTLPNIVLGEIAIKNKWYGDNMFLIFPKFDAEQMITYVHTIFQNPKTKACLVGWINITSKKNDVFLFSVEEKNDTSNFNIIDLTTENLKELYLK